MLATSVGRRLVTLARALVVCLGWNVGELAWCVGHVRRFEGL